MDIQINAIGALCALAISIFLILKKVPPAYGMMIGALAGGLIGGANVIETTDLMIAGAKTMIPAVLRILAAGILAGVLIQSGSAAVIAETIVKKIGEKRALLALTLATAILTAVGVFVDVAVITVAPIALAIAKRTSTSKAAILLAMIGGGKAGNIMSPNPNAIAASDAFHIPLTFVMAAGIIPAVFGLGAAYLLAKRLANKGTYTSSAEIESNGHEHAPSFWAAISGPAAAILLLALRPAAGITIDPMIALPAGGLVTAIASGQAGKLKDFAASGLSKMSGVAIMLIGTGTLAGMIANSELNSLITDSLVGLGLPPFLLAPISGILMSMATASTTAGTAVASSVFGPTLVDLGVSRLAGAAMIHAGATVLDHLPHGSFFHTTGGSVFMPMKKRLALIPYETAIGLVLTIISTLIFGVFQFFK
ncbi:MULTISPECIES: GntP family permease [Bacillus]|uniref:GntP family permease n=1 Tax=Bacillus glycinifermentans TaxID=1664069 RepID=A0AAJ3YVR5_9BACI|nr:MULTISPECIES: SLC13 family permease [Bacillus]KKB73201.1 gluconate:proton symporter [Bacillus sp. TH008]MDU0073572.1 SLC13 family permease [Bacillus sp. IG6]MED8021440.1 SLC13 family permease [Bacillus glycinifermentans]QAT63528.1 GntP family permease [Bacillus glycinifermentans]WKB77394.1 SLC13 family permease [Bacillus glycinifermentans]